MAAAETTSPGGGERFAPGPADADARLYAAMCAPHFHLTEAEAVEMLAPALREELLDWAVASIKLARQRDGLVGHELPNRNALVVAAAALMRLLYDGPHLAVVRGAA